MNSELSIAMTEREVSAAVYWGNGSNLHVQRTGSENYSQRKGGGAKVVPFNISTPREARRIL